MSLPSRGAWIEMAASTLTRSLSAVAPLAGSVDRNIYGEDGRDVNQSRSPRGERG